MFPELSTRQDEYLRRFPKFSRPKIIGYLSLDSGRNLLHDHSRLKFVQKLQEGPVHLDLNRDLDKASRADQNRDEKIKHLLQYLLDQKSMLDDILYEQNISLQEARVICYRGLLTCIANTPYENREGWRIVATLYNGHIFLCALDTEEKKQYKQQMTERDRQFTSWGYKFEQYILSDSPTSPPDVSKPNDENEEFSLVLTAELGAHRLLYAAEMDGVLCEPPPAPPPPPPPPLHTPHTHVLHYLRDRKFVELKTNRQFENSKQETNFRRFKARKWWCQSFLAGVENILCGERDDAGVVHQLTVYRVADLPTMCRRFWNADVCFNFVETFLTFVKRCLARAVARAHGEAVLRDVTRAPATALHLQWSPGDRVRVAHAPLDRAVLPDWFRTAYNERAELR